MKRNGIILGWILTAGFAWAGDTPETPPQTAADETQAAERPSETEAKPVSQEGPKLISGMSILGNQEAPKSLVIVPWKSSVLGDSLGIATMLDDSRRPVDREVFLRALNYYEIRSESTPQGSAPVSKDDAGN